MRWRIVATGLGLAIVASAPTWLIAGGVGRAPEAFPAPIQIEPWPAVQSRARELRDEALRHAAVWHPAPPPADLAANPPDPSGLLSQPRVDCRFLARPASGTSPKFDCVLKNGEVVKVKYGRNAEEHGEAATSRLLTALGFGADQIYLVEHLRCYGCPRSPFRVMQVLTFLNADELLERHPADNVYTDFEWPAVERRFSGRRIEAGKEEGWAWFELPKEEIPGGASLAELDAFRLMAIFLSHWDNKSENQRLVCLPGSEPDPGRPCPRPIAIMQDLGSTFGPHKVDLAGWRDTPIWRDHDRCMVSMTRSPYGGSTFQDTQISEAGRRHLAAQLRTLTDAQIEALFTGARFPEYERGRWFRAAADVGDWVSVFRDKVRQISDRKPCPS
jgi:hypothetical protein